MTDEIESIEDLKLQFARQLYETMLERYGNDHDQTLLLFRYMRYLENLASLQYAAGC